MYKKYFLTLFLMGSLSATPLSDAANIASVGISGFGYSTFGFTGLLMILKGVPAVFLGNSSQQAVGLTYSFIGLSSLGFSSYFDKARRESLDKVSEDFKGVARTVDALTGPAGLVGAYMILKNKDLNRLFV